MDQIVPIEKDWQTKVFESFARKSPFLIKLFPLVYFVWAGAMLVGLYINLTHSDLYYLVYSIGKNFGQAALILLGIVILPGILGRFKIEIKITRLITLFRRQLGITVFLLGLSHYALIRFFPMISGAYPISLPVGFEIFGTIALSIFFFMFLTSNNYSVKRLGKWWKRLHRFVYVAVWSLAIHTALQITSVWSIYAGIFAVLEVGSLIYDYVKKKRAVTPNLQQRSTQTQQPRQ